MLRRLVETERRCSCEAHLPAPRCAGPIAWRTACATCQTSAPLPPELLADCRFCVSREAMLDCSAARAASICRARHLSRRFRPRDRQDEPSCANSISSTSIIRSSTTKGLEGPEVRRHIGFTHEVIATFPDAHFDWVYIDADHSYDGCLRDARAAAAQGPTGRLSRLQRFRPYRSLDRALWRAPRRDRFRTRRRTGRWRSSATTASGLYDVAFRKPESGLISPASAGTPPARRTGSRTTRAR